MHIPVFLYSGRDDPRTPLSVKCWQDEGFEVFILWDDKKWWTSPNAADRVMVWKSLITATEGRDFIWGAADICPVPETGQYIRDACTYAKEHDIDHLFLCHLDYQYYAAGGGCRGGESFSPINIIPPPEWNGDCGCFSTAGAFKKTVKNLIDIRFNRPEVAGRAVMKTKQWDAIWYKLRKHIKEKIMQLDPFPVFHNPMAGKSIVNTQFNRSDELGMVQRFYQPR
jgi:hypothetical protein